MGMLSMNELTTYRWSFEEDVHNYLQAGIKAVSVWRHKLSDFGEEKGAELLSDNGLQVASLLWAGGFTGSDGRSFKESVEDGKEAIRTAAALRTNCLIVHTGARAGHTHNHARRLLKSAFAELLPLAAEHNITLALEPMHPSCGAEWTFLTDIHDTLTFLDSLNEPSLKIVFDTYHWGFDPLVLNRVAQLAPRIAIVQLGDAKQPPDDEPNRCPLGEGEIPLKEIIAGLKAGGYQGFFDVELMGEDIEAADYRDLLARCQNTFRELLPTAR